MKKEEILDEDSGMYLHKENVTDLIHWWEQKRLFYNLVLIGVEVIILLVLGTGGFGFLGAIGWSIAYTLAANAFFTIGWGIELWVKYYFPKFDLGVQLRFLLFSIGVIFSIALTFVWYFVAVSWDPLLGF